MDWSYSTNNNDNTVCSFDNVYLYDSIIVRQTGTGDYCKHEGLYGLNVNTGQLVWSQILDAPEDTIKYNTAGFIFAGSVKFYRNYYLYAHADSLYCYDVISGKKNWSYKCEEYIKDVIVKESKLFCLIGTKKKSIIQIDIKNGNVIKRLILPFQVDKISYQNKNNIILDHDSSFYCFNLNKKQLVWKIYRDDDPFSFVKKLKSFTGSVYKILATKGDTVYLRERLFNNGYQYMSIVSINIKNGKLLNKFDVSDTTTRINKENSISGYIKGASLYLYGYRFKTNADTLPDKFIVRLGLGLNKIWENKIPDSIPYYSPEGLQNDNKGVYFFQGELLRCCDIKTGKIIWDKGLGTNSCIYDMVITKDFVTLFSVIIHKELFLYTMNKNNSGESNIWVLQEPYKIMTSSFPNSFYMAERGFHCQQFNKIEIY